MNFEDFGLDFTNPDFVKYAESYGANGYRLESNDNFQEKISEIIQRKGVNVVDIPIDYSENERVLIQELRERTCKYYPKV